MPFDEATGHGGDGRPGRDPLRELALEVMDRFDQTVDDRLLCPACATRALLQEAMLSLLMIGHQDGRTIEEICAVMNQHAHNALGMLDLMKREGLL